MYSEKIKHKFLSSSEIAEPHFCFKILKSRVQCNENKMAGELQEQKLIYLALFNEFF